MAESWFGFHQKQSETSPCAQVISGKATVRNMREGTRTVKKERRKPQNKSALPTSLPRAMRNWSSQGHLRNIHNDHPTPNSLPERQEAGAFIHCVLSSIGWELSLGAFTSLHPGTCTGTKQGPVPWQQRKPMGREHKTHMERSIISTRWMVPWMELSTAAEP